MCKEFLADGGLDLVLGFGQLPCVPIVFLGTEAAMIVPQVLRTIGEHDQAQLTERMVKTVKEDLQLLPGLLSGADDAHAVWMRMSEEDGSADDVQTTRRAVNLAIHLTFLSEWLGINFGSQRTISSVIKALGVNSGSNVVTEIGNLQRYLVEESACFPKRPPTGDDEDESEATGVTADSSQAAIETAPGQQSTTDSTTDTQMTEVAPGVTTSSTPDTPSGKPKPKPIRQESIQALIMRYHGILTRFFKALTRLVFNKRNPDDSHKRDAAALADCIAQVLIQNIQTSPRVPEHADDLNRSLLGLFVQTMWDDRAWDGHLLTTVFIPFDRKGGMTVLLDHIRRIIDGASRLQQFPPVAERTKKQKEEADEIASGVRIAIMVLQSLASPHSLLESPQTHVIEQREAGLPAKSRFSAINTFVRIRRDVFPLLQQIWMAEWLPLLDTAPVRAAVSAFLQVMEGKNEEMEVTVGTSMGTPGTPLMREMERLRAQIPRPQVVADPAHVAQLVEMGFGQRSAQRALVRARNNIAQATDLLLSMPHLFPNEASPDATPATETPAVEDPDAADAPAAESSTAAASTDPTAASTSDQASTSEPAKDEAMDVEEDAPSPTAAWEAQREDLQKLRDAAKSEVAPRALQLLDQTEDLVFDLLGAFPKGIEGVQYIVDHLEEAAKSSPPIDKVISARLRLLSVFARQTPLLDLPAKDCQHGMEVIMSLPLTATPRPEWLPVALLAAESMLLMGYVIKDTKLGEDAMPQVVRLFDFGDAHERLMSIAVATIRDEDISRELTLACMRLLVVLTRHQPQLCTTDLMSAVLNAYQNPGTKLSGSYPYLAMLTRHAFDSKQTLREIMRREIREWMTPERNKVSDVNHFVRQLRQMAYRDATTFVEAVGDEGALVDPGPVQSVYHIRSKIGSQDPNGDDKGKESTELAKAPGSPSDPFQRSVVDAFQQQPVMDYFISELNNTMRDIQSDETAKRNGTEYPDDIVKRYSYAGLLLSLITEMVGSYMSAKTAFMAAVRQGAVYRPGKGKSGFGTVLADILCCVSLADVQEKGSQNPPEIRRVGLATAGMSLLIALCANVPVISEGPEVPEDLAVVRKIVLEGISKAVKDSNSAHYDPNRRYGRLWVLGQVIRRLLTSRQSVIPRPQDKTSLQLAKAMLEKNYVGLLTTTLADIDLNYPEVRTPIHSLLKALEYLTKVSSKWGKKDQKPSSDNNKDAEDEDEDSDASDVGSELMALSDEEGEAPEMYRNSALGILGGDIDVDDEDDDMDDSDMDDDDLVSGMTGWS